MCHQVRAFWGYLVRADEQSSQPQRDQDFSAPEWMNDAWVSHTNTTKYQHHSNNCISNSLRVLLFDVFNPIKVWSLISTMAMVSSLVAWAEITAGTAWQSAWHGSQHGIDKHWHLKLRCRPSKRLGQQAKNDKMTSKLTQLCSSLFLNILYISLYSIRDVVQHSNYDILWPYMTIFDPSRRSQTSSSISLPTELSASDGLGIKHISTLRARSCRFMMRGGNFGEATAFACGVSFKETLQYETVTINENRAGAYIHQREISY